MKITVKNYLEQLSKIPFEKLESKYGKDLIDEYKSNMPEFIDLYNDDEDIKAEADAFIEMVNSVMAESKPKAKNDFYIPGLDIGSDLYFVDDFDLKVKHYYVHSIADKNIGLKKNKKANNASTTIQWGDKDNLQIAKDVIGVWYASTVKTAMYFFNKKGAEVHLKELLADKRIVDKEDNDWSDGGNHFDPDDIINEENEHLAVVPDENLEIEKPTNVSSLKEYLKKNKGDKLYLVHEFLNGRASKNEVQEREIDIVQSASAGFKIKTDKGENHSWLDFKPAKSFSFTDGYFKFEDVGVRMHYFYEEIDAKEYLKKTHTNAVSQIGKIEAKLKLVEGMSLPDNHPLFVLDPASPQYEAALDELIAEKGLDKSGTKSTDEIIHEAGTKVYVLNPFDDYEVGDIVVLDDDYRKSHVERGIAIIEGGEEVSWNNLTTRKPRGAKSTKSKTEKSPIRFFKNLEKDDLLWLIESSDIEQAIKPWYFKSLEIVADDDNNHIVKLSTEEKSDKHEHILQFKDKNEVEKIKGGFKYKFTKAYEVYVFLNEKSARSKFKELGARFKKPAKMVRTMDADIAFIGRIKRMIGKEKTIKEMINLIKSEQKAIIKGQLEVENGKLGKMIRTIERKLYDFMDLLQENPQKFTSVNFVFDDEEFSNEVVEVAEKFKKYPSVTLVTAYVNMSGKVQSKETTAKLIKRINKSFDSGKMLKDDPYRDLLEDVVLPRLKAHKPDTILRVLDYGLAGTSGLMGAMEYYEIEEDDEIVEKKKIRQLRNPIMLSA